MSGKFPFSHFEIFQEPFDAKLNEKKCFCRWNKSAFFSKLFTSMGAILRATAMTIKPARANSSAMANPIPPDAPVTKAVRPVHRSMANFRFTVFFLPRIQWASNWEHSDRNVLVVNQYSNVLLITICRAKNCREKKGKWSLYIGNLFYRKFWQFTPSWMAFCDSSRCELVIEHRSRTMIVRSYGYTAEPCLLDKFVSMFHRRTKTESCVMFV